MPVISVDINALYPKHEL